MLIKKIEFTSLKLGIVAKLFFKNIKFYLSQFYFVFLLFNYKFYIL